MDVNLKDLKIEHREDFKPGRGASSRLWPVLFFVLLVAAVAAVYYVYTLGGGGRGVPVKTETVVVRGGGSSKAPAGGVSAAGWVKLPNYHPVYVTPLTSARIEEFKVIEGDEVEKGDVVAVLFSDHHEFQLNEARAALDAANASHVKMSAGFRTEEIEESRKEVLRLRAEFDAADEIWKNSKKLVKSGAIPKEELVRDRAKRDSLEAALGKALEKKKLMEAGFRKEDVAAAKADYEKKLAVYEDFKKHLGYCEVRSTVSGVVLERLAQVGQPAGPGAGSIASIYDPADLEARIDVPQDKRTALFKGQRVEITSRAEPGKIFTGRVVLIEPRNDPVKMTSLVKVKFDDPKSGLIFPEMVVTAKFLPRDERDAAGTDGPVKKGVPHVPGAAVVKDNGKTYVYVVSGGKAEKLEVSLGRSTGDAYKVLKGLRGGERVVVEGMEFLFDGAKVTPGK